MTPSCFFSTSRPAASIPRSGATFTQSIRQFRAEGRSVLLTTHYIEEAHALCDRIAILHRGRIVAAGTPDELIARSPSHTRLIVRAAQKLDPAALAALPGVIAAAETDGAVRCKHARAVPRSSSWSVTWTGPATSYSTSR